MKPKNRQASSDPLPYVQVDRAVKPKAGQLAGVLKVSRLHALGALVEFWELCGEPRELERLVQEGRREVVLPAEEIARRFRLASDGLEVDPADLVALGLLASRPEGFKVCGMSRYFAPIERRLAVRASAVAGGRARAAAGRGANGRFATAQDDGPAAGSLAGEPVARPLADHQPSASAQTSGPPAAHQPSTTRAPSTADSGQRPTSALLLELPVAQKRDGGALAVFEHWKDVMETPRSKFDRKRRAAVEGRLREGFTVDDLRKAVDGCSRTPHNMGQNDRGERYNDLALICRDAGQVERFMANADAPPVPRALRGIVEATAGSGPIVATEVRL